MACFRGNREEFYGEVLLLDESKMTLTAERGFKKSSKAAAILQQVFSYLNMVEVEFFGLRFCDVKQQTFWLDPSKTLSQHRDLFGPPYIFYFGVKFYTEEPAKLTEETTRYQFYLQICQDVRRGRLPCPAHLRPRLSALMLQADRGDHTEAELFDAEENQEVQHIYRSLRGVSRPQAQCLLLSLCSSLEMFGVFLFAAYGENQTEYFLGPTPVGVVIYKNKVLVGKYFWQRITKLHFKDETFELRVMGKNGSETSFFFQTSDRSDCKRLWRSCVEHHIFFRMCQSKPLTHKLNHDSIARLPTLGLPRLNVSRPRNKTTTTTTTDMCMTTKQQQQCSCSNLTGSITSEPVMMHTAPPAVHRLEGRAEKHHVKASAPWENSSSVSGLFNPKFPTNTKEEAERSAQRRSRSLDGDRPVRRQAMWSRSHGNASSGSESEKIASDSERHRQRTKNRRSPDAVTWKHIQKQLVEPEGLTDRQTEEIPYKEVRISGRPKRMSRSPRGRRQRQLASTTEHSANMVLLPPLPVTTATDTSCHLPTTA